MQNAASDPGVTVDLSKLELDGIDLSSLDGIDLSSVDLTKVDLSKVDLSGVDLSGLDLSSLDPSRVDLSVFGLGTGSGMGTGPEVAATFESIMADPSLGALAAAITVVGGTLLAGLALWLAGRKLVKPAFALLGAAAGGLLGVVALPASGLAGSLPVSLPPTWVGLGAGALLGLIIALAAFRMALIVVSALAGSALATLISVVALGLQAAPTAESPPLTTQQLLLEGVPVEGETVEGETDSSDEPETERADENTEDAPEGISTEKARAFLSELSDQIRETYWEPVPEWKRASVLGASFFGLILGGALGLLMPKKSATLITAFAGAGLWIPSIASIAAWAGVPAGWLDRTPLQWLVIWIVVSIVGVIIQASNARKKKRSRD